MIPRSRLEWTDAGVVKRFGAPLPGPGSRFGAWTPDVVRAEDRETALGTGLEVAFVYRTDRCVRFEVRNLPAAALADFFALEAWLAAGGTVTVVTGDRKHRTYTATLRPGTRPTVALADAALFEYTATLELRNTAAAPMLCEY